MRRMPSRALTNMVVVVVGVTKGDTIEGYGLQ
jgi:hypothetical protein